MIYTTDSSRLKSVQQVWTGEVNEVQIVQDMMDQEGDYRILWVIKNHETAKCFLEMIEKRKLQSFDTFKTMFTQNEYFYVELPYTPPRPILEFYFGKAGKPEECEQVCRNLLTECMASDLPYPILYLVLKQNQIHIDRDDSVRFGYVLDLTYLDADISEQKCVMLCAKWMLRLLEPCRSEKTVSYRLLKYKIPKKGYETFLELYQDIKISGDSEEKVSLIQEVINRTKHYQDRIKIILCVCCIVFGCTALILFGSQILFGDIPFLRLFINTFRTIGTQSLG